MLSHPHRSARLHRSARDRSPRGAIRAVALFTGALCAITVPASADSLGGVAPAGLASFTFASTAGAPAVVAHENFTGANGTNINGTTTDSGGFTWSAVVGTWTVQGNQARGSSTTNGSIVFGSTSSANGSIEATIARNGNTGWDTYVIVNANAAASDLLLANWWSNANGRIDLWKEVAGTFTLITSVSGLYPGGVGTAPASAVVRLESPSTSVVKVYLDGVLKITYTLSGSEQTTYKNSTHRYAGFGANNDGVSTFDNLHLDA